VPDLASAPPARAVPETLAVAEPAIRPLSAAEAEGRLADLADLLVDAVAHGASVNFLAGFRHDEGVAFWRGQVPAIREGSRALLVAEAGGRLVGTVVLTHAPQPNAPHRAEIGKMLVHSSLRRRGLGARLLAAAEAEARRAGRTLLLLDTEAGSAGEHLYRRCGWTAFGVVPNHSYRTDGRLAPTTFFYKEL
jgi:GNAT superfamily N-acetyltransferase